MTAMGHIDQEALSATLRQRGLDGWLVYDFHDSNPVARRVLGITGMLSRRVFLWLPGVGPPRAVVHNLDRTAITEFSGEFDVLNLAMTI